MKKIKWGIFSILLIPVAASAVAIPILVSDSKSTSLNYFNVFTTYDNAQDNMIALGYSPDYDNVSSGINHASYLDPYANDEITKYEDIRIMDGEEVNRKEIDRLQVDTIVLNEWERADEGKFKGIVNNIAYTSMGDSDATRYHEPMTTGGYTWIQQNSINAGFMQEAVDLGEFIEWNLSSLIWLNTLLIKVMKELSI